jgi:hypothetical protein
LATAPSAELQHEPRSRRLSPKTRWIPYAIIVIVVVPILWIAIHAFIAYDALMNIEGDVTSVQSSVSTDQFQSLPYIYADMKSNAATAASATSDPVWIAFEGIPVVGPNLRAVGGVAQTLNQLVVQGVGPVADAAKGFNVDEFLPQHGQVDMARIGSYVTAIDKAYTGILAAQKTGNAIDTTHTIGAVTKAVQSFRVVVESGVLDVDSVRKVMRLIPPALGNVTPQNYLVVLGNNGVDRANGGAVAAVSLVKIDNGKVTIVRTVPASALADSVTATVPALAQTPPFTGAAAASLLDSARTPDFPMSAAKIAAAWTARYGDRVDDVVSTDTTGLGYLAVAAGRVPLGNGTTVSAASIAHYLQSGVYTKGLTTTEVADQQAAALNGTLSNVIAGKGQAAEYLTVASQFLNEKRLLLWSSVKPLQTFLATTPFSGTLADSNAKVTTYGVFVNADSAAPSSPSLKMKVDLTRVGCEAVTQKTSSLALTIKSSATKQIGEDILVYGPVDFTYSGYSISGGTVSSTYGATVDGRSVRAYRVEIPAGATVHLDVKHRVGGATPSTTVEVRSTPRWDVTTVAFANCKA